MNTNLSAITVLCCGDSNTQGLRPDRTRNANNIGTIQIQ